MLTYVNILRPLVVPDFLARETILAESAETRHIKKKKELWTLNAPTAFHQSFDDRQRKSASTSTSISGSCGNIDEQIRRNSSKYKRRAGFCPGNTSRCSTVLKCSNCGSYTTGCSGCTATPILSSHRPPALGGRSPQSSFESNGDVGQISLNWMRFNGTIAPFKTLLKSSDSNTPPPTKPSHAIASDSICRVSSYNRIIGLNSSQPLVVTEIYKDREGSERDCSEERTIRITYDGEHLAKKSISNAPSDDLEAHRFNNDDSKTPLMKEKEKGGRLIKRQQLYHVRRQTSDYALAFSIIGIILMIVENELSAARVYEKNSTWSVLLKSTILLSTLVLVGLVVKFYIHEVQLFMNANAAEDWRIAFTFRRCLQIGTEVFVCGICPLPFDINFRWNVVSSDGEPISQTLVPLDVVLSIPMFLRIYWCARCMLLHSRLFTDASSRSIAGLNRVNFNARFILKTLMTLCPGTMLMVFTFCCWLIAGWIMRLCERHHVADVTEELINIHGVQHQNRISGDKHKNYLNSLWLIAITFLSVGYGDIVPHTYCGRAMAVITGILGTCTSSMVVAVIARKLELTRAEKHVHNFMMDTQLTKKLKHSAANVLRETWLIYKYRNLVDKVEPAKVRHHQRKFLVAIYALRKVKRDQRKLAENSVSLGDVAKTTSNSYELIHDIHSTQEGLALRMTAVEHQLGDIQRELGTITEFLRASIKLPSVAEQSSQEESMSHDSVRRRRTQMDANY